jgi:hypothetical protein
MTLFITLGCPNLLGRFRNQAICTLPSLLLTTPLFFSSMLYLVLFCPSSPSPLILYSTYSWFFFVAPTAAPTCGVAKAGSGNGLRGNYYSGINFNQFVGAEIDKNINFNWGAGAPAVPGIFSFPSPMSLSSPPLLLPLLPPDSSLTM